MIFSCFSTKVQVGFHIEIEYENDDISKLKTTACSNEDNKQETLKNLRVFCEIMHDNINVSKDFLYLRETETVLENKLAISSLNQDFIQSIDVKNSQKCDYGSSKFSLKRIFFNKPCNIIFFYFYFFIFFFSFIYKFSLDIKLYISELIQLVLY